MSSVRKQVILCTVGTLFEWYEFTVFALLTPIISILFFPSSNHFAAMMSTFAIFASGFIMRPIGALFFGHIGDTIGRKSTLLMTVFLMTGATVAIGLIPVGTFLSTTALVICRLIQGFSTSGEYPGGLTLLAEQPDYKHKGLITSFGISGTGAGCFMGALICAIILKCVGYENMLHGGWRIPFLLAAPLGILSFMLRKTIFESNEFKKIEQQGSIARAPILQLFRHHWKNLGLMLCISILANALMYINLLYLGNYSLGTHKLNTTDTTNIYMLVTFIYSISILFFGFLSDFIDKQFLLLTACILILCSTYPLFELALSNSVSMQFLAQGILSLILGMLLGAFSSILAESFPTAVRYTGLSVTLNIAASIFGGTAPIICGWLTHYAGTPIACAYYVILLAIIALSAIIFMIISQKILLIPQLKLMTK